VLTIERIGAIAYDAFCRSITKTFGQGDPNHYFEMFDEMVDSDIQKAWIAAAASVVAALEYEKKADA
jgi:hypothetical protein